jgi:hypothetical protein
VNFIAVVATGGLAPVEGLMCSLVTVDSFWWELRMVTELDVQSSAVVVPQLKAQAIFRFQPARLWVAQEA